MADATKMQTAYQSSMQILEHVLQAQTALQVAFGNGTVSRKGIITDVDGCNDVLETALSHLLEAQRRLAETPWPDDGDYVVVEAAD